ncbi:hypothetical protein IQ07DRAFT_684206 [Pyrenochaeta sp. DS3sAY3a]|nr:hypothetical protein IQ07DRAFT_684206 [Pyrenochaeta sp. DS3sAY3a]
MFTSRAITSRFVCKACSQSSFSSGLAGSGFISRTSTRLSKKSAIDSRCAFSTSATRKSEKGESPIDTLISLSSDPSPGLRSAKKTSQTQTSPPIEPPTTQTSSPIPWYLRQQAAIPAQAQKPAETPDLPSNPPPLLETLLEYVSITAGLDDLQLLDLRHLDPPPALGPKLIMLIGTARSEKHLHVAADRFCRWLRREHGLTANAAGLLGRNELKIKLRRKAKRMRMLANVGGSMPEGNIDDGIRTGWICCTLGKIEAHPDDMHMPGDDVQEFVGFREVKPGVNVVVQMFTEEKRQETDLETLWGGVLRTHARNLKTAEQTLEELEQDLRELDEDVESDQDALSDVETPHTTIVAPPSITTPRFKRPQPTTGDAFPS